MLTCAVFLAENLKDRMPGGYPAASCDTRDEKRDGESEQGTS